MSRGPAQGSAIAGPDDARRPPRGVPHLHLPM